MFLKHSVEFDGEGSDGGMTNLAGRREGLRARPRRPSGSFAVRAFGRLAAGPLLLAAMTLSAWAGPMEDAGAAFQRGDYATAVRIYRGLADRGDVNAQNSLGNMYLKGLGTARNEREALRWFRRAAALGLASAQFNLGQVYLKGVGVDQDLLLAALWYSRAAEQGHAGAQFTLAVLYSIGTGVPENAQRSAYWFERAASQGHAEAQSQLGILYATGRGRARNPVVAYKWLALARTNERGSNAVRAKAVESLERLAATMTQAQIAEAQRLAREWRPLPSRAMP